MNPSTPAPAEIPSAEGVPVICDGAFLTRAEAAMVVGLSEGGTDVCVKQNNLKDDQNRIVAARYWKFLKANNIPVLKLEELLEKKAGETRLNVENIDRTTLLTKNNIRSIYPHVSTGTIGNWMRKPDRYKKGLGYFSTPTERKDPRSTVADLLQFAEQNEMPELMEAVNAAHPTVAVAQLGNAWHGVELDKHLPRQRDIIPTVAVAGTVVEVHSIAQRRKLEAVLMGMEGFSGEHPIDVLEQLNEHLPSTPLLFVENGEGDRENIPPDARAKFAEFLNRANPEESAAKLLSFLHWKPRSQR